MSLPTLNLLELSRPRFWMYTFGPYIVGLIIGANQPRDLLDWRMILFAAFFLFPANLFIYGINDIHDWETDQLNAKKSGYENSLPPARRKYLQRALWQYVAPFLLIALLFTNARAILSLVLFAFLAHQYSAPPIRAKARPLVDSLFNLLYVCPAFFAYSLLGGQNIAWPFVIAAWCWVMAMHAYSAVPDISADNQARVPTIATWLGLRGTLWFCLSLYLCAAILSFSALTWLSVVLGSLYVLMIWQSLRANSEAGVMNLYRWFPLLNTFAGFCLFWRVALSKWF